ncbi:MAG: ribbon-helix-helix domain-containing protein [Alphaproteobacteria bacterium]
MPEHVQESRNVMVQGHRTSMRLEAAFWNGLEEICRREDMTINQICTQVSRRRGQASLTAAVRVFVVSYFRRAAEGLRAS